SSSLVDAFSSVRRLRPINGLPGRGAVLRVSVHLLVAIMVLIAFQGAARSAFAERSAGRDLDSQLDAASRIDSAIPPGQPVSGVQFWQPWEISFLTGRIVHDLKTSRLVAGRFLVVTPTDKALAADLMRRTTKG